jgi:hypothetical protein
MPKKIGTKPPPKGQRPKLMPIRNGKRLKPKPPKKPKRPRRPRI